MTGRTTDYVAYGLRIRSSIALPLRTAPEPDDGRPAGADVTVRIGATPARLPNPVAGRRRPENLAWETAPGAFLMTKDDEARYLVTGGRDVVAESLGGSERKMGAFLIGSPFAALLQQRGLTTLHAGAVEAEGGAVLIAGLKGTGKSTLLGALVERGYALLSEDLTGVEANVDGRFVALPASVCVRLRADSLENLGRRPQAFEKAHEDSDKHLMPAARLCAGPTAVRAVYVLKTHDRAGVDVRPASWTQAYDALLRHTFRKRFLFGLGRQEAHFRTIREMVAQAPVFFVSRPAAPFRLHALAERIAAHFESDAATHPPPPDDDAEETSLWESTPETAASRRRKMTGGLHGRGGLFEQAGAALQRKLAADPNDVKALLRLADLHRSEGRLDAALDACRRVAALRPGHPKASWLCAVLGGADLPDAPQAPDVWPAPFVRVRSFLPPDEHAALLALFLAGRERFVSPARIGPGYVDDDVRRALVPDGRTLDEVRPGFEPRLRKLVEDTLPRLGMGSLGAYRVEVQMSAYPAGGFYRAHSDETGGEPNEPEVRRINCLYYLHRQPRPFTGGDLLLHDGEVANTFTRIEPRDNSIVLFPSRCVHEVTLVECDPGDFGAGRFTVSSYVWERPVEGSYAERAPTR